MFEDIPVEVGIVHEGERIRQQQMHVEFGGPKVPNKFELVQMKAPKDVKDGKVTVVGKGLADFEARSRAPIAIIFHVAGKKMEKDLEPVLERRIHDFFNYVEGVMHLNQRYDIWIRVNKEDVKKGLTLEHLGKITIQLMKQEFKFIEKMEAFIYTDEKDIESRIKSAREIYEARDARARTLTDDEVDEFYGCILCQSFAPIHICVITPERMALCGAISWFDARASARIDPEGPNFVIEKGEVLDAGKGQYSGVDEAVDEKSGGVTKEIYLHSMFGLPHTSCGCFEAIVFYIPEIDGVGLVNREYMETCVNGLKFSQMAEQTGGGEQTEGFLGTAVEYFRSKKFLQGDGGWTKDKIATEDVKNLKGLKSFLEEKGHPLAQAWAKPVEEEIPAEAPAPAASEIVPVTASPATLMQVPAGAPAMTLPAMTVPGGGGFKFTFKNARIYADKVIIQKAKE
jgi:acetyl-CoA decarbonylase/synthase complex subunit beta